MADEIKDAAAQVTPEAAESTSNADAQQPSAAADEQVSGTIVGGDEGGESGAEKADEGEKAEDASAPTEYTDFALPEGWELPEVAREAFTQLAKDAGLPQDKAQKLVDLHIQIVQEQMEQHSKLVGSWAEEVKADKELGGSKYKDTLADIGRAMSRFATPELRALLNDSGLGNHPEIVRFVAKVGRSFAEDAVIQTHGQPAPSGEEAFFRSLYPNSYDDMAKAKSS